MISPATRIRWWITHQIAPFYPRSFGYHNAAGDIVERRIRGAYTGLRAIRLGYGLETRAQARDNGMPDHWTLDLYLGPFDLTIDGPEHHPDA